MKYVPQWHDWRDQDDHKYFSLTDELILPNAMFNAEEVDQEDVILYDIFVAIYKFVCIDKKGSFCSGTVSSRCNWNSAGNEGWLSTKRYFTALW